MSNGGSNSTRGCSNNSGWFASEGILTIRAACPIDSILKSLRHLGIGGSFDLRFEANQGQSTVCVRYNLVKFGITAIE